MLVLNHLFPVFAIIILGAILKYFKITTPSFITTSDRLNYYIFFPALLFWKIGGADQAFGHENLRFYLAVLCAIAIVYGLSTGYILLFRINEFRAGSFSQSCYRFNTYIGMAVIFTVLGEKAAAQFGVLIGVAIPLINVGAVTTLIWFSGRSLSWDRRIRMTLAALVTNPLILACVSGIAYARWINHFPQFVENMLALGATVTLPLALLSIGGSLTLNNLRHHWPLALAGSVFKLLILPVIGWVLMDQLHVDKSYFPLGMLFFSLPTSTAIYVLSAQLNSDTELAAAAVVLSTGLSFFSMSAALWYLQI